MLITPRHAEIESSITQLPRVWLSYFPRKKENKWFMLLCLEHFNSFFFLKKLLFNHYRQDYID